MISNLSLWQDIVAVENKKIKHTELSDDDDHVSDYYDANGKIATLRKKRSTLLKTLKKEDLKSHSINVKRKHGM